MSPLYPPARRFGSPATDYSEFELDGTLVANGAATTWNDSMVPATYFRSGATALAFEAITTNLYGYRWDLGDEIQINVQIPHQYKVNSVMKPHLHLLNKTAVGATAYNVGIEWIWTLASIGSAFPDENAETQVDVSFQNSAALTHHIAGLADITPTTGQGGISQILIGRLKRVAGLTESLAGANIWILGFDVHFEQDTIGSRAPTTK